MRLVLHNLLMYDLLIQKFHVLSTSYLKRLDHDQMCIHLAGLNLYVHPQSFLFQILLHHILHALITWLMLGLLDLHRLHKFFSFIFPPVKD